MRKIILAILFLIFIVACAKAPANKATEVPAQPVEEKILETPTSVEQETEVEEKIVVPEKKEIVCPSDLKKCPSGSYVARVPPSCAFAYCPEPIRKKEEVVAQSGDVIQAENIIKQGNFVKVNNPISGHVDIMRKEPRIILRLTSFQTESRPYLYVYLAKHNNPALESDIFQNGFIDVGPLKEISGDQEYYVPGAFMTINEYNSVAIYDKARGVVVGTATLEKT
ncbi:MAG: DM13 domain-containing protein [Candidatus Woesearchaeota archaeon]